MRKVSLEIKDKRLIFIYIKNRQLIICCRLFKGIIDNLSIKENYVGDKEFQ